MMKRSLEDLLKENNEKYAALDSLDWQVSIKICSLLVFIDIYILEDNVSLESLNEEIYAYAMKQPNYLIER